MQKEPGYSTLARFRTGRCREALEDLFYQLLARWKGYEAQPSIMDEGRSSYSKTDEDATFMRMKEDHMRNGQLKPGYNVQFPVNSEYITGIEAFSDQNDVETLKPFLRRPEGFHRARVSEKMTA